MAQQRAPGAHHARAMRDEVPQEQQHMYQKWEYHPSSVHDPDATEPSSLFEHALVNQLPHAPTGPSPPGD